MKKITKKNLSERLAKYGALSLAIAGVADASGQVVYTDVDPDFTGGMGDSFAIDFNDDGVDDVIVAQSVWGAASGVRVQAEPGNGVIAASNGGYFYASNLAYGASISAGAGSFRSFGDACYGAGYAGSQFCGMGEGYIGIEFDADGDTHYGWVRIDVFDSTSFIIMDFAFESEHGATIQAGDEGEPASVADELFSGFSYLVDANSNLTLDSNLPMQNVVLHNLIGQEVISQKLSSTHEVINMANLKTGVYLATVSIDNHSKTFKIAKK